MHVLDIVGPPPPPPLPPSQSQELAIAIILPVAAVAILAVLIVCIMKRCHNIKMKSLKASFKEAFGAGALDNLNGEAEIADGIRFRPVGDSTLRAFGAEDSLTSGSGSGKKRVLHQTFTVGLKNSGTLYCTGD